MPLMQKKSKAAFEHNFKAEMNAGKPKAQSLAIAYSVKRKPKKKASGGTVESGSPDMNYTDGGMVNAKSEKRPMPNERNQDSKMVSQNTGNKPPRNDDWTQNPMIPKPKTQPIKYPKMVPSSAFSTRLRDEEDDLQSSASTNNGPQHQPPEHDNEEGPDRQGPKVPDMQDEHSNHRKPYAKGGMVDMEPEDLGIELSERDDEAHLESSASPSEDEGTEFADSHDEMEQDRQGPQVSDMEDEHSTGRKPYARGGEVSPNDEIEEEKHNSIAAAIMSRRDRMHAAIDSGALDMDEAVRMADGGMVDIDSNNEEQPNGYYNRNEDAALKENYDSDMDGLRQPTDSNEIGDSREDDEENRHDMISQIRSKMNMKRQFR